MDIVIDHKERFEVPASVDDALGALHLLNTRLREQGRAILRVIRDGRPVPYESLLEVFEGVALSELASLEVETGSVVELVREAVEGLEQSVPELPNLCHQLAEVFQGENPADGYAPFEKMVMIWSVIKERELQVSAALNVELDGLSIRGREMKVLHDELNKHLSEAAEALAAEDCVLLGDLLEYELAPRAELEADIVALLKERAQIAAGQ